MTPYWDDDLDYVAKCVASVKRQSVQVAHFLITDGSVAPKSVAFEKNLRLIQLPRGYRDYGNTPRFVGCRAAIDDGFDAIAFLDADNWFQPEHIASMMRAQGETGAWVAASQRMICGIDGAPLGICLVSGTPVFCDTSCMMLFGPAVREGLQWGELPLAYQAIGDRLIWKQIANKHMTTCFTGLPTVAYRARHRRFYERVGATVPVGVRSRTGAALAVGDYLQQHGVDLSVEWAMRPWTELAEFERMSWEAGTYK